MCLLLSGVFLTEHECGDLYDGHEIPSYNIYKMLYACCQELVLANLQKHAIQLIQQAALYKVSHFKFSLW
jgi:hypothetical protein